MNKYPWLCVIFSYGPLISSEPPPDLYLTAKSTFPDDLPTADWQLVIEEPKVVKEPRQEIIASETFERVVPAQEQGMQAVVDAFDEALGSVIKDVKWTLTSGG